MIGNKHMPVEFLPVYYTQEQLEEERSREKEELSVYGLATLMAVPLGAAYGLM